MSGLLRADFYRILKSKGLPIILGGILFVLAVLIAGNVIITWLSEDVSDNAIYYAYFMIDYATVVNLGFILAVCFLLSGTLGENFTTRLMLQKLIGYRRSKVYFCELLTAVTVSVCLWVLLWGGILLCCLPYKAYGAPLFDEGLIAPETLQLILQGTLFDFLLAHAAAGLLSAAALASLLVCLRLNMRARTASDVIAKLLPVALIAIGFIIILLQQAYHLSTDENGLVLYSYADLDYRFVNALYSLTVFFPVTPAFAPQWMLLHQFALPIWGNTGAAAYAVAAAILIAVTVSLGMLRFRKINID